MKRIVVIGAGIVGAHVALDLARAGADVIVVDRGGDSASQGSLAWLNVSSTPDPAYSALRRRAMLGWRTHTGAPITYPGCILWGDRREDPERRVAELTEAGWPAEQVDSARISELAPGLREVPPTAYFAPEEGHADPAALTQWVRAQAERAGASFAAGEVILTRQGGQVSATLADGTALDADAVILAAGAASDRLLAALDLEIDIVSSPGMTLRTTPMKPVTKAILAGPLGDCWQGTDGRIWAATDMPDLSDDSIAKAGARIVRRLGQMFGADVDIEKAVARERPMPRDNRPILGAVPGHPNLWVAVTHSGMTLAPVLAEAITAEVLTNDRVAEALPYTAERAIRAKGAA